MEQKPITDGVVEYQNDQRTKDELFERVARFLVEHNAFNGECCEQCDDVSLDAPGFLGDLAEEVFQFRVTDINQKHSGHAQ